MTIINELKMRMLSAALELSPQQTVEQKTCLLTALAMVMPQPGSEECLAVVRYCEEKPAQSFSAKQER